MMCRMEADETFRPESMHERAPIPGRVAAIHFFTRRADGVSLQMQENHDVLSRLGWEVVEVSADALPNGTNVVIPELDYRTPAIQALKAGKVPASAAEALFKAQVQRLKARLQEVIRHAHPRVVHVRNLLSLPIHPAATVAMAELIREHPELLFVTQHHDFVSESDFIEGDREQQYTLPYPSLQRRVHEALLPDAPHVRHAVISAYAQRNLLKDRGIQATIIHDSFNFATKPQDIPDLRARFGIRDTDIVVGMMTRIAPRKGIEVAIQFVAALQKRKNELCGHTRGIHARTITEESRFLLLLPQEAGLDEAYNRAYYKKLLPYAKDLNVEVRYIGDNVVADRAYNGQPDKVPFYSLYALTDIITYPSYQEGFGNQFLEAVALGRGMVVGHEYPVFETDILPVLSTRGIVSLGNNTHYTMQPDGLVHLDDPVLQAAVEREVHLLTHPDEEKAIAAENSQRLQGAFGSHVVGTRLAHLLSSMPSQEGVLTHA
jgi:glycosyltransferase involved in cell wall biosynthesis